MYISVLADRYIFMYSFTCNCVLVSHVHILVCVHVHVGTVHMCDYVEMS